MRVLAPAFLILLMVPASAQAAIEEQDLPPTWTNPSNLLFSSDGALWLTLDGTWAIGRWDLAKNETQLFPLETPKRDERDSMGTLLQAEDGTFWTATSTHAYNLDPDTGDLRSYELPEFAFLPGDIHIGPTGNVWIAQVDKNRLLELDPETSDVRVHPVNDARGGPLEFEETRDGTVYLTTTYADTIATFDPTSGALQLSPSFVKSPVGLAAQEDSLWIAEMGYSAITLADLTSGNHTRYPTSASPYYAVSGPSGILVHPDGSIWFAEHFADRIARFDGANRYLHEYEVPSSPGTNAQRVVLAPSGDVWFAEYSTNKIGRATYSNEPASFILPANVSLTTGESVELTVPSSRMLKTGTPDENLTVAPFPGKIRITAAASLAPGAYEILVATTEGKTTVGRYMTVNVEAPPPSRESPAPPALAVLLFAGILALARRRR